MMRLPYGFVSLVLMALAPLPSAAQVSVASSSIEVSVPMGQDGEVDLVVKNEGAAAVSLFAVPLPQEGMPEDVGTLLFHSKPGTTNYPLGLAMMPAGRLFAATYSGGGDTREYTLGLTFVREIESPHTDLVTNTTGLTWMPSEHAPPGHPEGTLWWLDLDTDCDFLDCTVVSTLLIEGDLDGVETGRTVALTTGPGVSEVPSFDRGLPFGLSYDPDAVGPSGGPGLFYYTDIINESFYAVDIEGTVAEGYPAPLTDYDPGTQRSLALNSTVDASYSADGGAYFEVGFVLPGESDFTRVVVTDRDGRSTGVETPLGELTAPDGETDVIGVDGVLRSPLDPSVMYLAVRTEDTPQGFRFLYAVRAAPLPPRWLRAEAAAPATLDLAPGATDTLTMRLSTDGLAQGSYAGRLDLRTADAFGGPNGEIQVTVPVTLTVTEGTAGEGEPQPDGFALGAAYPNPSAGTVTIPLALGAAADVRVAVFDVLGREVAVLHNGQLAAGERTFTFDTSALPAGVYVVRATGGGSGAEHVFTVVR